MKSRCTEILCELARWSCYAVVFGLFTGLLMKGRTWVEAAAGLPVGQARLWQGIGNNDAAEVRLALAEGAVADLPNDSGQTPLVFAACMGSREAVRALLRAGADVERANGVRLTPLLSAITTEQTETVRLLLRDYRADPNHASGSTPPLVAAVRAGNYDLVVLLLQAGADVDLAARDDGMTALDTAIERGRADLVELLRWHGAAAQVAYAQPWPQKRSTTS